VKLDFGRGKNCLSFYLLLWVGVASDQAIGYGCMVLQVSCCESEKINKYLDFACFELRMLVLDVGFQICVQMIALCFILYFRESSHFNRRTIH